MGPAAEVLILYTTTFVVWAAALGGVIGVCAAGSFAGKLYVLPEDVVDPDKPWPDGPLGDEYE